MPLMYANVDSDILIANINGISNSDLEYNKTSIFIDGLLDVFRHDFSMRVMLINFAGEKGRRIGEADRDSSIISVTTGASGSRSKTSIVGSVSTSRVCSKIREINKPIVIAHQSRCSGDNLLIALSCDFRIAEADAVFEFYDKLSRVQPTSDVVKQFVDVVGPHWARLLIMANMPFDAREACTAGLVHKVFPDLSFDRDVLNFCRHIALQGPDEAGGAKHGIRH